MSYASLRAAIADLPKVQRWFIVGPPWGKGDFIVSGHPDPHIGEYVADTEDFDGEKPFSLEYAGYIAEACPAVIRDLLAERDSLAAELERLREDGRRLDFLERCVMSDGKVFNAMRDRDPYEASPTFGYLPTVTLFTVPSQHVRGEGLRSAIDAAREGK